MYPNLFPTGSTGPCQERRPRSISFKGWVRYCLLMKDNRFRDHHDFMFSMFNIIQRIAVSKLSRFKIRGYSFHGVTSDMLKEALQEKLDGKPISHLQVTQLLRKVQRIGALIEHSPFRKTILRQQIFGMITERGWPTFFLTVNPSDVRSPLLKLSRYNVEERNNLLKIIYNADNLTEDKLHSWMKYCYPGTHASAIECSNYFHKVIQAIIEVLCGFNYRSKTYSTGLLGNVTGHFGVVE
ncbi:hypothetical protein BC833DRAFT_533326, partial [Globomyces pollinis-pini]